MTPVASIFANVFEMLGYLGLYVESRSFVVALATASSALGGLFVAFKASTSSCKRSRLLFSMLGVSASFWIFLLASLAFCVMFFGVYEQTPDWAAATVAKLALVSSAIITPLGIIALRNRAGRELSAFFFDENRGFGNSDVGRCALGLPAVEVKGRVSQIFSALCAKLLSPPIDVRVLSSEDTEMSSFSAALDWRGRRLVAISENIAKSLEDDELQAVLAHEIAHIKFRDAAQKTVASAYRFAFQFDPLSRFIEAAIYRERELAADEFAAECTKKPASLASALLKIYQLTQEASVSASSPTLSFLSLGKTGGGFLSKEPSLRVRIERLLSMSQDASRVT